MYKLEFLPIAKKDIDNIVSYVYHNLKNTLAAAQLANEFIVNANNILNFPYGFSEYKINLNSNNVYRCVKIKNFLMFYLINETNKTIIIVRVLYKKMNIEKKLN